MKYWRVEIINNETQEAHFIEALNFSKKRIKEIFKEVHPEWNIKKIVSIDAIPTKENKEKKDG